MKCETVFFLSFWGKELWTKFQIFQQCLSDLWMNRISSSFNLTASSLIMELAFEHLHWGEQESKSEPRLTVPESVLVKKELIYVGVNRTPLYLGRDLPAHEVTNHSCSFLYIFLPFCGCLSSITSILPGTLVQYMFELSLGAKGSLAISFPTTNEKNKPEVGNQK